MPVTMSKTQCPEEHRRQEASAVIAHYQGQCQNAKALLSAFGLKNFSSIQRWSRSLPPGLESTTDVKTLDRAAMRLLNCDPKAGAFPRSVAERQASLRARLCPDNGRAMSRPAIAEAFGVPISTQKDGEAQLMRQMNVPDFSICAPETIRTAIASMVFRAPGKEPLLGDVEAAYGLLKAHALGAAGLSHTGTNKQQSITFRTMAKSIASQIDDPAEATRLNAATFSKGTLKRIRLRAAAFGFRTTMKKRRDMSGARIKGVCPEACAAHNRNVKAEYAKAFDLAQADPSGFYLGEWVVSSEPTAADIFCFDEVAQGQRNDANELGEEGEEASVRTRDGERAQFRPSLGFIVNCKTGVDPESLLVIYPAENTKIEHAMNLLDCMVGTSPSGYNTLDIMFDYGKDFGKRKLACGNRRLVIWNLDGHFSHMEDEFAEMMLEEYGVLVCIGVAHSTCVTAVNDKYWNWIWKCRLDEEIAAQTNAKAGLPLSMADNNEALKRAFLKLCQVGEETIQKSAAETGSFPIQTDPAFFVAAQGKSMMAARTVVNAQYTIQVREETRKREDAEREAILQRQQGGLDVLIALLKSHVTKSGQELQAFDEAHPRHLGYEKGTADALNAVRQALGDAPSGQLEGSTSVFRKSIPASGAALLSPHLRAGAAEAVFETVVKPRAELKAELDEQKRYRGAKAPLDSDVMQGRRKPSANAGGCVKSLEFVKAAIAQRHKEEADAAAKAAAKAIAAAGKADGLATARAAAKADLSTLFAAPLAANTVTVALLKQKVTGKRERIEAFVDYLSGGKENGKTKADPAGSRKRLKILVPELHARAVELLKNWINSDRPVLAADLGAAPAEGERPAQAATQPVAPASA